MSLGTRLPLRNPIARLPGNPVPPPPTEVPELTPFGLIFPIPGINLGNRIVIDAIPRLNDFIVHYL